MRLCALVYRGQLVEVTVVDDAHRFGEHGNHFHVEVEMREQHLCRHGPHISLEGGNDGNG